MQKFKDFLVSFIVTCCFVGRVKFAPGTLGSICAFPIYYAISFLLGIDSILMALSIGLLFIIGVRLSSLYIENIENKDPKEVVIDEVVGQMIVIYFCNKYIVYSLDDHIYDFLNIYILPFSLFRFFDICKPWPIILVDKNLKSGFGIMFDDVLAAIFTIFAVFLIRVPI